MHHVNKPGRRRIAPILSLEELQISDTKLHRLEENLGALNAEPTAENVGADHSWSRRRGSNPRGSMDQCGPDDAHMKAAVDINLSTARVVPDPPFRHHRAAVVPNH